MTVQDATMIQAENNNISVTEFSNVSGHFMEDINTPKMDFSFPYYLKQQSNLSVRTPL